MAPIGEELRLLGPHAVEHLQLVCVLRHAELLGTGDAVAEAAEVVAPECRPQPAVILHQEAGQPLEIGVRLPFLAIDGNRPAVGLGDDRFVVPICPLHQPHPDRRAAAAGPFEQVGRVAFGFRKVGLQDDSDVRKVAELVLHQDVLEDFERQVLVRVLLHVDVDVRVVPPRRA